MNYITLIRQFWRIKAEYNLTSNQAILYLWLVEKCNKLNWKNPFRESERYLSKELGISHNTIRKDRLILASCGLITFTVPPKGSKATDGSALYYLIEFVQTGSMIEPVASALTGSKFEPVAKNEPQPLQNLTSTASMVEAVEPQPLQNLTSTASMVEPQPLQNLTSTASMVEANNKPSSINNKPFLNENEKSNLNIKFLHLFPEEFKGNKLFKEFVPAWGKLMQAPNWNTKSEFQMRELVTEISRYNPAYVASRIPDVIIAGYPRILLTRDQESEYLNGRGMLSEVF